MLLQSHKGSANVPPENSTAYEEYMAEGRGEAAYVATMLVIYAVSIAFMIGYLSFKKNKYRQWDREANMYLNSYYKRQIKHEKTRLQTFADTFNPGMTVLFATGLAIGNLGRPRTLGSTSGGAAAAAAAAVVASQEAAASVAPGRGRGGRGGEWLPLSEIVEAEEDDDVSSSLGLSEPRYDLRSRLLTEADVAGSLPPPLQPPGQTKSLEVA